MSIYLTPKLGQDDVSFLHVSGYPDRMDIVRKVFKDKIEPLYGSQAEALKKIELGSDRKCRILSVNGSSKGVVVCKKELCNEYGLHQSFEVKTLLLIDSEKNSGKGYGSDLLAKVVDEAKKLSAKSIHVTVSDEVPESLKFFTKKGFKIKQEFENKYKEGVTEYLLSLPLVESSESKKRKACDQAVSPVVKVLKAAAPKRADYREVTLRDQYLRMIQNGTKTVDVRVHSGMFTAWQVGTRVRFYSQNNEVFCQITRKNIYRGFKELLSQEDFKTCVPEQKGLEEATRLYESIPGYKEKAARFGVVAFQVKVEPKPAE